MTIGLKGAWKRTNGDRLKVRVNELIWDIRYAWQRAWRGYDNADVFSIDSHFIERYKAILKNFNKTRHCLFNIPEKYREQFNGRLNFTDEETSIIIDTMIYHLEMMNEDNVEKVLCGTNIYDKDYNWKLRTVDDLKRIASVMNQNKEAFMKLFNDFFWDLWD